MSHTIEDLAVSDEEWHAACDQRTEVEKLMCEVQSVSAMDVLMKLCAVSQFGEFVCVGGLRSNPWHEARAILA